MIADVDATESHASPTTCTTETPLHRRRGGGPKTAEGKERSRRNALKHGLRAKVCVPDELAELVSRRASEFALEFPAKTPYQGWLVSQIALASVQLDRCAALSIEDLQRRVDRAALCWDGDQRNAIESLGTHLATDPSRIVRALRQTSQGADWLIERWEGLGEAATQNGGWNDDQRRLAFDLLGTPLELRDGRRLLPVEADGETLQALVTQQVDELRRLKSEVLDELDAIAQSQAAAGLPVVDDAISRRLHAYEASCRRYLQWAIAEYRRVSPEPTSTAPPKPPRPPRPPLRPLPPARPAPPDPTPEPAAEAGAEAEAGASPPPHDEITAAIPKAGVPRPPRPSTLPPLGRRARRALEKQARDAARRARRQQRREGR